MNTKKATADRATFGSRFLVKMKIQSIEDELAQEGDVLHGIAAPIARNNEYLIVTNRKVSHIKITSPIKVIEESIPIESITGSKVVTKGLLADIKVNSNSTSIKIENVPIDIAKELRLIINNLV